MVSMLYGSVLKAVFRKAFAVFFNTTGQYKVGIFQRLVVDQPVQLGSVKTVVGNLVLNGDGVNGNLLPSQNFSSTQQLSIL